MIDKLKTKFNFSAVLLVGGFLLFSFIFFPVTRAQAATSTLRGTAWWGNNYGYVSFNCLDDTIGDLLDVSGNLYPAFHFYSAPCSNLVHGVYINSSNNFSGQAWNNTEGLISFEANGVSPPSYAFNSACTSTCDLSNNCWACYNEAQQKVYGWARVVNDGTWIKLDNSIAAPDIPVKLQSWDLSTSVLPGHGIVAGDFVGDATSTIGNLSFNCESEGGGAGTCATRNYQVYISNLQVGHLSAPNWNQAQACSGSARSAVLRWYKKSGQQTGYEIVVNNTNTLSTSTAVCWSGRKNSAIASQYILPNSDPNCGSLSYNTNYYWWIRLYDENGQPTEWYQYNTNSTTDTDANIDNNVQTFTTYKHELPRPLFTWEPTNVLVGTSTNFTSNSQYYTTANPGSAQNCSGSNCTYLWSTSDADALISRPTNSTTSIKFFRATATDATLEVTDVDNYTCSTSTNLNVNYALPIWREVKAK